MLINSIKEPTYDEIRDNRVVAEDEHEIARACWYPQMGGYVGKCVVITSKVSYDDHPPCFTALVWHDGEFPFGSYNLPGEPCPRVLHHCSAEQFVTFGNFVTKLQRDAALTDKGR